MSSSESDEDFIEYGTPLDPLEEGEIPNKKPCLVEDQVAKDKWGRRRFHGAFTGGFSAGFFNTVGSLEGWKPSSFKSSKSEKQKVLHQRPEDFMDEEDKDVFGIAPVVLKAKQGYLNVKKRKMNFSSDGSPLTAILKEFLRPVRETVGMRLLKKMGWKSGQGVGAKITRIGNKRTLEFGQKVYGCDLPPALVEQEEMDSDSEMEQLFPEDYDPILFEPKNNFFGLGYKGLDKSGSFSQNFGPVGEKNQNFQIRGQAFGVGAFEEEDEDIYSKEDMSHYDFSLGITDSSHDVTKKTFVHGILSGFVSEETKPVRKDYLLPALPKNFKSHPEPFISKLYKTEILGKKALLHSQYNFNNQIKKKVIDSVEIQEQNKAAVENLITNVQINMNKFKPFYLNPDKQERYEKYLKLVEIGKRDCLSHIQPMIMTDWDKEKEKLEFEQAAKLFKPLSGVMEERFLTASEPDDISDFPAVKEKFNYGSAEQNKAAKMKMYGTLTRTIEDWVPCHLLCKRFNIPYSTKSYVEGEVRKPKTKCFEPIHELFQTIKGRTEETVVHDDDDDEIGEIHKKHGNGKVEEERLQKQSLDETVNKIDLFRAIFLDSDEEEEKKNFKEMEEKKIENSKELSFDEKVVNSKRNESPPHGIFENIDLEALNILDKARNTEQCVRTCSEHDKICSGFSENGGNSSDMVHGPKIPDKFVVITSHVNTKCVTDDNEWVEKRFYSKKHKKKIKKKDKKCSRKSSHKHKRVKKSH